VGILLGIIVFGDRIQVTPGQLAIQAGGVAALIVGVIMVGRAPALSQLRSWTPPGIPHAITGILPGRFGDGQDADDSQANNPPSADGSPNGNQVSTTADNGQAASPQAANPQPANPQAASTQAASTQERASG
jgi:hypothetical protein